MKDGIHPDNYRMVVFKDMSNEYAFLSKSAAETKETIQWEDGNEYPLVKIEVSHKSHPFYTGKAQFVDTAGRIDKFRQKYAKFNKGDKAEGCPTLDHKKACPFGRLFCCLVVGVWVVSPYSVGGLREWTVRSRRRPTRG